MSDRVLLVLLLGGAVVGALSFGYVVFLLIRELEESHDERKR